MSERKCEGFTVQKRIVALITAIVMAMALSLSVLYVAKNSNHTCSNSECQVCQHIDSSLKLMNSLTPDLQNFVTATVLCFAVLLVIGKICSKNRFLTPVNLKVKLTN